MTEAEREVLTLALRGPVDPAWEPAVAARVYDIAARQLREIEPVVDALLLGCLQLHRATLRERMEELAVTLQTRAGWNPL